MPPTTNQNNNNEQLYQRPKGVLLDEEKWLYLKERYRMTTRELQVAILVCRGFNNEEIAKALKIKQGTVKTHLRNIYRRVRVKTKITLLLKFVEDINNSSRFSSGIRIEEKQAEPSTQQNANSEKT